MYVCSKYSTLNGNSNTPEPDWPQHEGLASCVITKQYSSASFVSIALLLPQGKICTPFKCYNANFSLAKIAQVGVVFIKIRMTFILYLTLYEVTIDKDPQNRSKIKMSNTVCKEEMRNN
jgi:hypothetical protein